MPTIRAATLGLIPPVPADRRSGPRRTAGRLRALGVAMLILAAVAVLSCGAPDQQAGGLPGETHRGLHIVLRVGSTRGPVADRTLRVSITNLGRRGATLLNAAITPANLVRLKARGGADVPIHHAADPQTSAAALGTTVLGPGDSLRRELLVRELFGEALYEDGYFAIAELRQGLTAEGGGAQPTTFGSTIWRGVVRSNVVELPADGHTLGPREAREIADAFQVLPGTE